MSLLNDFLDETTRLSRQQLVLRATAPAGTALMVVLEGAAGGSPGVLFLMLAALLSLLVAALPDSGAGTFLVLLLGGHWLVTVPEHLGGSLLLAALVLTAIHLATALAAYGPPGLVLDRELLLRWARRYGLLAAAAAVTWLAARLMGAAELTGGDWLLVAAFVVLAGWAAYLNRRLAWPG
jgi:hypothetical protein